MKIKIEKSFSGHKHKVGDEIELKTDSEGTVIDQFWRRRVRDSKIDNCISIVSSVKSDLKKSISKSAPSEDKT